MFRDSSMNRRRIERLERMLEYKTQMLVISKPGSGHLQAEIDALGWAIAFLRRELQAHRLDLIRWAGDGGPAAQDETG